MSSALTSKKCVPCEGGVDPVPLAMAKAMMRDVPGWTLSGDGKMIGQDLVMKDFGSAVDLIQRIADVAEAEDHHPDLHLTGYRKLRIELSTHAIGGLSENDFILAAKINELPRQLKT